MAGLTHSGEPLNRPFVFRTEQFTPRKEPGKYQSAANGQQESTGKIKSPWISCDQPNAGGTCRQDNTLVAPTSPRSWFFSPICNPLWSSRLRRGDWPALAVCVRSTDAGVELTRSIRVDAIRDVFEAVKMFWPQGFADFVFLAKPFAQIDEAAAAAAERAVFGLKPFATVATRGAFDFGVVTHT